MWRKSIGYEIQEPLGEGSQGQVFKALRKDTFTGLQETVAVKILHSETAVDLWRREFESLRRVRSSYCVQVFAFERIDGRPALILEYVDGISLATLAQSSPLNENLINEILNQMEAAIVDLCQSGLFHGDLSPHNILADRDGRLKLLDFGLANGNSRFTPEFAAPERFAGEPASFKADIFSLGRLEQFLRGQPFTAHTESSYLKLNPNNRALRNHCSNATSRKELGAMISHLLERRALSATLSTRTIQSSAKKRSRLQPLAMSIAFLIFLSTASSAKSSADLHYSNLHIRTARWHYFILDGTPLGYSPLSISLKAGRAHRLEWISKAGRGFKILKSKPQASLTLQDRDFSH